MFSILNRELSWAITSFENKFCLKMRSRLIKVLNNRFYVKFMQLEIGLLLRNMVQQFNLSHVRQLEINCQNKVLDLESRLWLEYCSGHPNMNVAQACLENVSSFKLWSLADLYPDLVSRLYTQVRLMGNLCLNGGIPWLFKTEGSLCFICEGNTETVYHHFIECSPFRNNYNSLWSDLKTKIINFNQTDGITISDFITNLDPHKKDLILLGGLSLPLDDASVGLSKRSVASVFGKIHKLRTAKLRELEAPWLTK